MKNLQRSLLIFLWLLLSSIEVLAIDILYSGTAGSGGELELQQTDYVRATGNNAQVSASIPLQYTIPKEVAISIPSSTFVDGSGYASGYYPNAQEFAPIRWTNYARSKRSMELKGLPHAYIPGASAEELFFQGAIYSNTDFNIQISQTPFYHTTDNNMTLTQHPSFGLFRSSNWANIFYIMDWSNPAYSPFPASRTVSVSSLTPSDHNIMFFEYYCRVYLSSLTANHHGGSYVATVTITINSL